MASSCASSDVLRWAIQLTAVPADNNLLLSLTWFSLDWGVCECVWRFELIKFKYSVGVGTKRNEKKEGKKNLDGLMSSKEHIGNFIGSQCTVHKY